MDGIDLLLWRRTLSLTLTRRSSRWEEEKKVERHEDGLAAFCSVRSLTAKQNGTSLA